MTKKPTPLSTYASSTPAASTPAVSAPSATDDKLRQKVFRLTPAQDRRLKEFCAHSDMSIQDVVLQGLSLVLKGRGLPEL